jgi:hypothetical protein
VTTSQPRSLDEAAELMRRNLPAGVSLARFGAAIGWGRGNDAARQRITTLTREELDNISLTKEQAKAWAIAYEAVQHLVPGNPSAAGRAELMRHAARLLEIS